ncbi:unnamed protein product [Microthlaspi erraticum]|uniref:Uncharacterized protein n=1 Tax=Microthlaspi erraticum TaxID=1685480 RepID=A0A6D2HPQ1_9BRAS|nr:unnamed protein product [Microthlaspi erraticum]
MSVWQRSKAHGRFDGSRNPVHCGIGLDSSKHNPSLFLVDSLAYLEPMAKEQTGGDDRKVIRASRSPKEFGGAEP